MTLQLGLHTPVTVKLKGIIAYHFVFFGNLIVIYSDREHCYEQLKKKSVYDENLASDMYLNVCVCDDFLAAINGKK